MERKVQHLAENQFDKELKKQKMNVDCRKMVYTCRSVEK